VIDKKRKGQNKKNPQHRVQAAGERQSLHGRGKQERLSKLHDISRPVIRVLGGGNRPAPWTNTTRLSLRKEKKKEWAARVAKGFEEKSSSK